MVVFNLEVSPIIRLLLVAKITPKLNTFIPHVLDAKKIKNDKGTSFEEILRCYSCSLLLNKLLHYFQNVYTSPEEFLLDELLQLVLA